MGLSSPGPGDPTIARGDCFAPLHLTLLKQLYLRFRSHPGAIFQFFPAGTLLLHLYFFLSSDILLLARLPLTTPDCLSKLLLPSLSMRPYLV